MDVLLMIIGAVAGMPPTGDQIREAYERKAITPAEGKLLVRYTRWSPKGRKAAEAHGIADEDVKRTRDGLARKLEQLEAVRAARARARTED